MPIFKRTFAQDLDLLEYHLTKEIISQTDCKTILTKLRTTFENAFNSEFKERMQKYTRFDTQLTSPEIVQETTEKVIQIKQRMQAAHDRQKSYVDLKCKPMEFQVGDRIMLKVSPWKGVPKLPQDLSRVHNTFHVSNLKKCYSDEPLAVPLEGLHVDDKLHFVDEPVEITDREVKRLKQSHLRARLARWCDLNIPEISNLSEWISWLDSCQVTKKAMSNSGGFDGFSLVGPMDIYDSDGGIGDSRVLRSRSGVWPNILRSIEEIKKIGVPLDSLMTRKVVSSEQTSFWNDDWLTAGGVWAWRSPPRGRADSDLHSLEHLFSGLSLQQEKDDVWTWNADISGKFFVKCLSDLVQSKLLTESNLEVLELKWNSWVPKKVNICLWRASLNRLPTRSNLTNKGINLDSDQCLFCNDHEKTLDHCLIRCPHLRTIWLKIWSWWNIQPTDDFSLDDILSRKINLPFKNKRVVKALFGVCYVLLWSICKWRNEILHATHDELEKAKHEDIFSSLHIFQKFLHQSTTVAATFSLGDQTSALPLH
ncbi:putative reverse transcriptase domain-containing protein [Tanacetum coccineum]